VTDNFQNDIKNLIEEFNFNGHKKFKLIVLFGLLGDFDSFEYAINLKSFIDKNQDKNLDIFANMIYDTCESIVNERHEIKDYNSFELDLIRLLAIQSPISKNKFDEIKKIIKESSKKFKAFENWK